MIPSLLLLAGTALAGETRTLTLDDALRLVVDRNPDLQSADLARDIAAIEARRAKLDRFSATVTATGGGDAGVAKPWKDDAYAGTDASWDTHANLAVPLYAGGSVRASIDSANAGADIAALDRLITARSLQRSAYTAYWNIKGYELQIEAAQEGLDLTQQALDIIVAKADAGLAAGIDVNRSKVDLYAQQETLVEEKAALYDAQQELLRLLHYGDDTLVLADPPPAPSDAPVTIPDTLPERPELARKALEARQAADAVTSARAGALPSLSVTATAGGSGSASGVTGSTTFDPDDLGPSLDASVGLSLSWNLFDLLQTRDAVAVAKLQASQVDASTASTRDSLAADLRRAASNVRQLRERAPLVDAQVALARDNLQIVQGLYGQGSATILDLFNAQASFRQARTQGASLRVQLATAEYDLRWLSGEPLTPSGTP